MQPLLTIDNLSIDFVSNNQTSHALYNISLTVSKGEIVALVGESGSGKSITSLSVLKLLPSPPAKFVSGNIYFHHNNTVDLLHASTQQLQQVRGNNIAMIFQEPMTSLNPVMQCGKQVSEAISLHKKVSEQEAFNKTLELFKQVQLPQPEFFYHRYPHQLSGGQKQRVMIAMAMSCSPDLLICDEPTTALDVTVQKSILLLIKQLQQQNNMGVIFISHDLGVVSGIADKIAVMYKGRIAEQGTSKEIFLHPKHSYTKALLACRPASHSKGERLPVVSDFMQVNELGEIPSTNNTQLTTVNRQPSTVNPQPQTVLSVQHLKVYFPSKKTFLGKVLDYTKAVDDVSFDVFEGETLGLVGGSGSGKTTLGRAILQLIKPTEGKIFFRSQNLSGTTPHQLRALRKQMQIIFQDPYSSLNPRKKIGEAIAEPLLVHNVCSKKQVKEKVIQLLEKVNLSPTFYHRYPHEFSGGQRQRIVIARALALHPSFVICDESLSALDVSVQAQVLNLLNDLKREFGFTAIFISHDLSVVRYISDRIIVMNNGKIEETGNAEEVYKNPQSDYTKQLLNSVLSFEF